MHRAQLQGFLLLQACCSWWPERPKLLQSRSHQPSLNEQMLRRKSRWALQNLGYPENKELEMLSKDRRCRWRQAAGSILGFGQSWESRAGLCALLQGRASQRAHMDQDQPFWRPLGQHWGVSLLLSALRIIKYLAHEQEPWCTQDSMACPACGMTRQVDDGH